MTELISGTTRGIFRRLITDSSIAVIDSAFQHEGWAPNPDSHYPDSSVRRSITQDYLENIDWQDHRIVAQFLVVAERLLHGWGPAAWTASGER